MGLGHGLANRHSSRFAPTHDFLQSRPEVDGERIGMVGISGGGLVTQFTAALDDRIKAACVSGFCSRFEACILSIHHCIDNYVPGLGAVTVW